MIRVSVAFIARPCFEWEPVVPLKTYRNGMRIPNPDPAFWKNTENFFRGGGVYPYSYKLPVLNGSFTS